MGAGLGGDRRAHEPSEFVAAAKYLLKNSYIFKASLSIWAKYTLIFREIEFSTDYLFRLV